jgi:hypothetical protein
MGDNIFWNGFENQGGILKELQNIFMKFSALFPDASKHLKRVDSTCWSSNYSGLINSSGEKITLVTYEKEKGDLNGDKSWRDWILKTFIHELGHLLHMYYESSSISNYVYAFTRKNLPKNIFEAPSKYALTNRFEAFAEGFLEWWTKEKEAWSIYTKKIDNFLDSVSKMKISLIRKIWGFVEDIYFGSNSSTFITDDLIILSTVSTGYANCYIGSTQFIDSLTKTIYVS